MKQKHFFAIAVVIITVNSTIPATGQQYRNPVEVPTVLNVGRACEITLDPRHTANMDWQAYCLGAVRSIWDITRMRRLSCPGPTVSLGDAIRAILDYISRQRIDGDEYFTGIAVAALEARWPCRN